MLPHHERRLDAEIAERYGPGRTLAEVSEAWRPYRTWAAVHLRAARAAHRRDHRPLSHPGPRSAARLARARRLAREQDLRNVSFVQADAQTECSAGRAHVLVDGTEDGVRPTFPRGLRVRLPRSGLVHPPEIAPRVLDTGKRQ